MATDNAVADCQTQTHTQLIFRRKERIKDAKTDFFGHASTGIVNGKLNEVIFLVSRQGEGSAFGHSIDGIEHQIDKHLSQFRFISHDEYATIAFELKIDMDIRCLRPVLPARTRNLSHVQ